MRPSATSCSCRITPPRAAAAASAWRLSGDIVAEHGGNIDVTDNLPTGTRFIIELPALRAILSSTTNRVFVPRFSGVLQDEGFDVDTTASSAEECLEQRRGLRRRRA